MACLVNPALWVQIIVIIALVSIIRIIVPWLMGFFGFPAPVVQIINIVLWAGIAIAGVYLLVGLFGCMLGGGGLHVPTLR